VKALAVASVALGLIALALTGIGVWKSTPAPFSDRSYHWKTRYHMQRYGVPADVLAEHTEQHAATIRRAGSWLLWAIGLQVVASVLGLISVVGSQ
jgi:hypothetical protein